MKFRGNATGSFIGLAVLAFVFVLALLGSSSSALAKIQIPKNLTQADRSKIVEIIGLGSTPKLLSDPYPLGGYKGLELGIGSEVLTTSEIGRLGSKASTAAEISYSILRIGKGLYNDIDIFLQFMPQTQSDELANFGGHLRWGIYQAEYVPFHLSLVVSLNSMNFGNLITTNAQAADFVGSFNVYDVTLYAGAGSARASAIFIGGTDGVTDTGQTELQNSTSSHFLAGIHLKFSSVFFAMQMDRYAQSVYSAQIGTRF